MCGIVGYVGERSATPILVDALRKLEYRGYDSSGVGVVASKNGKIILLKTPGKIANLDHLIRTRKFPEGNIGISHTRWATHGVPSRNNAHPHFDCSKKILLVHNGIIENYEDLRKELKAKGHKFTSDTDTEVIVHLIEEHNKGDIFMATQEAIRRLRGAFALGVISQDEPDKLIAARVGSPLIIGIGKNENFIASDVPAIIDSTRKIIYLKDGEIAVIDKASVEVYTFAGKKVAPKVSTVTFDVDAVQKQGYAHFMLKEIHEQPHVLSQMLKTRVKNNRVVLEGLGLTGKELGSIKNIIIVACGTAYHAGMVGKYFIEKLSGVPVAVDLSSEFRYRSPIINKKTLFLTISQSGETADTLAAVKEAKQKGAKVVSICNVLGSSLTRESDGVLYTHAGPEIGVASTKAYTAQIAMLYLFALKLGALKKFISSQRLIRNIKRLSRIPAFYKDILKNKSAIAKIARANSHF